MSKYTTELRYICENAAGLQESGGQTKVNEILEKSCSKIFDFDYPIFDEDYRIPLEKKILRHFYTREICEETVGLWKLRLEDKMNMIMPYYNQMYKSTLLEFNPFYDVDLNREHNKKNDGVSDSKTNTTNEFNNVRDTTGESESNGNSSGNSWNLFSDTPQGGVNGIVNADDSLLDNTYLTDARRITDSNEDHRENENTEHTENTGDNKTNTVGNTVIKNVEDYVERVYGKQGSASYSELLKEFRKTFLNIDSLIIDELEDLFFILW